MRSAALYAPLTPPVSGSTSPAKQIQLFFSDKQHFSEFTPHFPEFKPHFSESTQSFSESRLLFSYPQFLSCIRACAPAVDLSIICVCFAWYAVSVLSSNSAKIILRDFRHPITLTQCQFLINMTLSALFISVIPTKLAQKLPIGIVPMNNNAPVSLFEFLKPSKARLAATFPMGVFQVGGHIASHKAACLILVLLLHTVKGLCPLTTVFLSRVFLGKVYPFVTYLTLVPLVAGIMLCCYKRPRVAEQPDTAGYFFAFLLMLIFVCQNMFAKDRLTVDKPLVLPASQGDKRTRNEVKLPKLSVVFYCLVVGFMLTLPAFILGEMRGPLSKGIWHISKHTAAWMAVNGMCHFLQLLMAFQLLGMMLPINYSVANICKRVVVIAVAFLWENKQILLVHGVGLCLTVIGLYCYDKWGIRAKH